MTNLEHICPACGSRKYTSSVHDTYRCSACGHNWYLLDKIKAPLATIYQEDYFKGGEYTDYEAEEKSLKHNFKTYCRRMNRWLAKDARILEVGCAYGYFLDVAAPYYKATGIDIAKVPVEKAHSRGLNAKPVSLLDLPNESPALDAVCLWDCIEHLDRPLQYLQAANRLLSPNGKLFLTTGNQGSVLARIQKSGWRMYHPPTHLHYFTPQSMQKMLEAAGFRALSIGTIVQWHSPRYLLETLTFHGGKSRKQRFLNFLNTRLAKNALRFPIPVATFDIFFVAAEKVRDV